MIIFFASYFNRLKLILNSNVKVNYRNIFFSKTTLDLTQIVHE